MASLAKRLLHVDGDIESHRNVKDILRRCDIGCAIAAIFDGRQAIQIIESTAFDLIILDSWMPGRKRICPCRHIRRTGPLTLIVVLFVPGQKQRRRIGKGGPSERFLRAGRPQRPSRRVVRDLIFGRPAKLSRWHDSRPAVH
jgi:CheY-like chemotaxis protein